MHAPRNLAKPTGFWAIKNSRFPWSVQRENLSLWRRKTCDESTGRATTENPPPAHPQIVGGIMSIPHPTFLKTRCFSLFPPMSPACRPSQSPWRAF